MVILTNLGQLTRDIFCSIIRLKNHSKLVEGSLFAIIDLLLGAKFINLYFIGRAGGYHFHKKSQIEKKNHFHLLHSIFSRYYSSIDLMRQSKHSRLRPDTSSLAYGFVLGYFYEQFQSSCVKVSIVNF